MSLILNLNWRHGFEPRPGSGDIGWIAREMSSSPETEQKIASSRTFDEDHPS